MRKDSPRQAGGLINVTPFWVILMANVKEPEPGGGEVGTRARTCTSAPKNTVETSESERGGLWRSRIS